MPSIVGRDSRGSVVEEIGVVRIGPGNGVEILAFLQRAHAHEIAFFLGVKAGAPPVKLDRPVLVERAG